MLRSHQEQLSTILRRVVGGEPVNRIIASITPGGGKSLLPQIMAARLIPRFADKICWVVPRLALQEQAAMDFQAKWCRKLIGHELEIRESTNDVDPSRSTCGYVTTYDAIGVSPDLHRHEFARHKYLLVLDEPHHVHLKSDRYKSLVPLVEQAKLTLLMTGTLERNDNEQVAFVPYRYNHENQLEPDLRGGGGIEVIKYGLSDAIRDHGIITVDFEFVDAAVSFYDRNGSQRNIGSLAEAGEDTSDGLYTALSTEYADELLDRCVAHWQSHRRIYNGRSLLLVVCKGIQHAKKALKRLADAGINAEIATSEDSAEAQAAIRRFREQKTHALVTVAMAYEGLNVPSITHIACLTHIRSRPWIEQMIARATRFDKHAGPWKSQRAYVFTPDDQLIKECIQRIKEEQIKAVPDREDDDEESDSTGSSTSQTGVLDGIIPLASQATRSHVAGFGDDHLDYEETRMIQEAMERHGLHGASPLQIKKIIVECGLVSAASTEAVDDESVPLTTPKQREANLRKSIETHVRRADRDMGYEHGTINKRIYKIWEKPRSEMHESELLEVWKWVQSAYPLVHA